MIYNPIENGNECGTSYSVAVISPNLKQQIPSVHSSIKGIS